MCEEFQGGRAVLAQDFERKEVLNIYLPSFIQLHPGPGRVVDGLVAWPRRHIWVVEGVGTQTRDATEKQ